MGSHLKVFGRIAKQNPVYEMLPSIRLRQQFGLARAFKFIAEWPLTSFKLHMKIDLDEFYLLWPWPWRFQVSRSNLLLAFNFIVPRPW